MKIKSTIIGVSLALTGALSLIISGCATSPTSQQTMLIADQSKLKPSPDYEGTLFYLDPKANFKQYSKIIVPPVKIFTPVGQEDFDTKLLNQIAQYYHKRLVDELGKVYSITKTKGSDTLKAEVAITAIEVSHENLKIYQYIPIALVFTGASRASGASKPKVRVLMEGKLSESTSGDEIALVIDQNAGKAVKSEAEVTLESIKPVLDGWATRFGKRLQEKRDGR